MNKDNFKVFVRQIVKESLQKGNLFHTTSWRGLEGILHDGVLKPDSFDKFVSLAPLPHFGDISGNDVSLEIEPVSNIMKVRYTEEWFKKYPEHASYVAGEGWREQIVTPEECYDEEYEEYDEECEERAFLEAELDSFLYKSNEEEWISTEPGESVPITIKALWLKNDNDVEMARTIVGKQYPIRKLKD